MLMRHSSGLDNTDFGLPTVANSGVAVELDTIDSLVGTMARSGDTEMLGEYSFI